VAQARSFTERLRRTSAAPVLYAEMKGAQHAFDIFPSYRAARVIEGTERFLTSVRRVERHQAAGPHSEEVADETVDQEIDQTLDKVDPRN
jgi:hypothetical protein